MVVPSTLTPPKTLVDAVGSAYVFAPDITPVLELIVMVVPSTLTPPISLAVATGNLKLLIVPEDILAALILVNKEPLPLIVPPNITLPAWSNVNGVFVPPV